ncbi:hypothetical protein P3G55_23600 [Leptospira sp. 96542]|nr:hypothetical protein [Leptospira sp. 96542]
MKHTLHRTARALAWALVLAACVYLAYCAGVEVGKLATFHPAFDLARAELQAEMREACPCWFDDSRCKQPGAVVACRMPEWMYSE